MTTSSTEWRRLVAIAVFAVGGVATAFGAGAQVGRALDRQAHATTVAKVPLRDLERAGAPSTTTTTSAVATTSLAKK
jgi:hypothetical protein